MEHEKINIRVRVTGEEAAKLLALIYGAELPKPPAVTVKTTTEKMDNTPKESVFYLTEAEGDNDEAGLFDEDRARARWDRGEEALLSRFLLEDKPVEEVAKLLGRSEAAVRGRMSKMGITFQGARVDKTDAVIKQTGNVTTISIKNPVLQTFVHSFVEAHREDYNTMTECLEAAADAAGCSTSLVKRIHYKMK